MIAAKSGRKVVADTEVAVTGDRQTLEGRYLGYAVLTRNTHNL